MIDIPESNIQAISFYSIEGLKDNWVVICWYTLKTDCNIHVFKVGDYETKKLADKVVEQLRKEYERNI